MIRRMMGFMRRSVSAGDRGPPPNRRGRPAGSGRGRHQTLENPELGSVTMRCSEDRGPSQLINTEHSPA